MFSNDEEILVCLVCLVIPVFQIGRIVPNRASVIVGVCRVRVRGLYGNEKYIIPLLHVLLSPDGLLWLPSAYCVTQADPC